MIFKKWDEVTKLSLMNFFLHLYFLSPVVVFFYQSRGLNYFQILALESVLILFLFLFEVPTGIFADKFGRKKSIVLGALLLATEPLIFLFAKNFLLFAIAFALYGIGLAFLSGTIEAFVYDYLKRQNKENLMKKAMGSYGSASLLAMVIAPVIGSYLAKDLLSSQFIFLIYLTLGFTFFGFVISLLIKNTKKKEVEKENPITLLKDGIRLIKQNKLLLRIILLSIFSTPFWISLDLLYQPYFKNSGVSIAIFGTVFAIALSLSALFKKYAYKFEEFFGMKRAVFLATILPGLFYILMAFIFHPIWAIILFVLVRGVIGIGEPLFSDYKNIHIPSRNRATVLSLISMLLGLYLVVMRLIIGKLADYNLSYSFIFMGIVIISASIFLRISEKHVEI